MAKFRASVTFSKVVDAKTLMAYCQKYGVSLLAKDGNIVYFGDSRIVTPALKRAIKEYKKDLLGIIPRMQAKDNGGHREDLIQVLAADGYVYEAWSKPCSGVRLPYAAVATRSGPSDQWVEITGEQRMDKEVCRVLDRIRNRIPEVEPDPAPIVERQSTLV